MFKRSMLNLAFGAASVFISAQDLGGGWSPVYGPAEIILNVDYRIQVINQDIFIQFRNKGPKDICFNFRFYKYQPKSTFTGTGRVKLQRGGGTRISLKKLIGSLVSLPVNTFLGSPLELFNVRVGTDAGEFLSDAQ